MPGLKAIGMIEAVVERNKRIQRSVCHSVMSRELAPERLLELVWNHWGLRTAPLGAGCRDGRGPDAEPDRSASPPGAEHRALQRRQALAQRTNANRRHERQLSARTAPERGRQTLKANPLAG